MSDHSAPPPDRAVEGDRRPAPGRPALVWLRPAVLVLIVALAAVVAALVGLPDGARLQADVAALGPAAPALFVLLYAVATLAPLPKNVLTAAAGLLFGLLAGVVIVLLGALLGAVVAFALGRSLGRDAVERITGTRVPASTHC